jgi:tetratricopeptide (TPR) repeat protein
MHTKRLLPCLAVALMATSCAKSPTPPSVEKADTKPSSEPQMQDMGNLPMDLVHWSRGAQLYEGLGDFHRQVSTSSEDAQKYFDQGMRLMWAFNHDESTRSFARAAQLDPQCAMCYWGAALTVGPNYNFPVMAAPRSKVAFEALQGAQKNASHATPVEQALIVALAKRYPNASPLDPSNEGPILTAYATAMKEVAEKFREDSDVQTMYAESMMNLHAWKLWTSDGKPAPGTEEIVTTLETVLKRDPKHPGANHYYVHAIEASPHPERAVPAAETLRGMMPAAGHLEHMPAHIMQRVGRYEDASEANRLGANADQKYLASTQPPDYYGMYLGHNYQFLAYSTAMEGRRAETLDAVSKLRAALPEKMMLEMPGFDWYLAEYYMARLRFGIWDEILAEPAPNPKLPGLTGGYLYARGFALANTGKVQEAKATLAELEKVAAATPADYGAGNNLAKDVFALARTTLKAQIANAEHDTGASIVLLRQAANQEDNLSYDEPSAWFFPVRHILGAQLLRSEKAGEAEAVYREDLRRNPNNGWALFGLAKALELQKKPGEAAKVEAQLKAAWVNADIALTASAL